VIRVVLLGQPFWSARLAAILNRRPDAVRAEFLPLRALATPGGLRRVLAADIFLRVGFRPGATTWRGRMFDALWAVLRAANPRARAVHYWQGTDVLHNLEDLRAGRLRPGPMARAGRDRHWAVAPWLVEELAELGLDSSFIALPISMEGLQAPERLPFPFTVLTYIPDFRWEFYDGPSIYRAAQALPEIQFEVIGGEGAWVERPLANLCFFGWQRDVRPFLDRATVVLRLVRHDGVAQTVREAMEAGRPVIYSQTLPWVTMVPFQDPAALEAALRSFHQRFEAGQLPPNLPGREYARSTYALGACLDRYLEDLGRLQR
jgi:glycosyltransferase involved in cell wall biosynthesis